MLSGTIRVRRRRVISFLMIPESLSRPFKAPAACGTKEQQIVVQPTKRKVTAWMYIGVCADEVCCLLSVMVFKEKLWYCMYNNQRKPSELVAADRSSTILERSASSVLRLRRRKPRPSSSTQVIWWKRTRHPRSE